ncbi:MAG TPA: cobaltochelatase subunit CobN [Methylosinus sp.]|jgi:cobaltochelatase CobN|uniref:cobaltochelatase subunit CobN n=1 Tax=Methylosinus sp. TaxID=427 RepID=UPI002F924FC4
MKIRNLFLALAFFILTGFGESGDAMRIAFVFEGKESTGAALLLRAAEKQKDVAKVDAFTGEKGARSLSSAADLEAYDVVFIDGATEGLPLTASEIAALRDRSKLVVVNPRGELRGGVDLDRHRDIATYWSNRSLENDAALIAYLAGAIGESKAQNHVTPPIVYPKQGFYHPDAPKLFETRDEFLAWYSARRNGHAYDPKASSVGLSEHLAYYRQQNVGALDAMIREIEAAHANAVALLRQGSVDFSPLIDATGPIVDVLLYHGEMLDLKNREDGLAQARRLGVPILQALASTKSSATEYRASPGGVAPELTPFVVNAERDGMLEPIVVAAAERNGATPRAAPMAEQVKWRVDRALAWAKLRRSSNAGKRVVFTYWSEAGGKADLGGDPDDFLDVQGTLAELLANMRTRGYETGAAPLPTAGELGELMSRNASNIGSWAPAELAARAKSGSVALIPEARYLEWYGELPEARRHEIEAAWGPPPGKVMTTQSEDGTRMIVIPRLEIGNILIAPHPMWGYLEDEKVLHSKDALPPHHQYLAFFLWLRHEWKADAWVSLFSNIALQPGKSEGPLADDHIGLLLGGLPHIHPERLGANGAVANKRKAMALAYGWYNIVTPADVDDGVNELRALLRRYDSGSIDERSGLDASIRERVKSSGVVRALGLDVDGAPLAALTAAASSRIRDLQGANAPWGGKILGSAPRGDALAAMVRGMLGEDIDKALSSLTADPAATARELTARVVVDGKTPEQALDAAFGRTDATAEAALARGLEYAALLKSAPREIDALFEALDGRWIEPGPMGEPFRRPETLPPGRTLYGFDQKLIPTVEAQAVGVRQAEALVDAYRKEHGGAYPSKLALVLFSADIAKTNGVSEAQILHLLGARPKRNWRGEVIGVELLARAELGRPRVDVLVTTSGTYRDHYQDKVALIDEAVRLAAASPEPDNPISKSVALSTAELRAKGENDVDARLLAAARVFSPAPGAYSPSIQFLAQSGEQRGDAARMAELFTRRMSHAYGGGLYGRYSQTAFSQNLAKMDAAMLPRTSDVNALLDNPMPAAFLGGLSLAAKQITGRETPLFISDLRNLSKADIQSAEKTLQTELRTRYFNPKWLRENQAHGYDGARNFMFLTDQLDLWSSTTTQMVASEDWAEVKAVFVDDKFDLGMDAFFDKSNPFAQQMLLTNLLGAAQRGHWRATRQELAQVAKRLAESVSVHGPSCDANQCRNSGMTAFVETALAELPDAAPLSASYQTAINEATASAGSAPDAMPTVTGHAVEEVQTRAEPTPETELLLPMLIAFALLLVGLGWFRESLDARS